MESCDGTRFQFFLLMHLHDDNRDKNRQHYVQHVTIYRVVKWDNSDK